MHTNIPDVPAAVQPRHNAKVGRDITDDERAVAQALLARARSAMAASDHYDQAAVDRLCRAVAWATGNEQTFGRLTRMSVEESGMGSAEGVPARADLVGRFSPQTRVREGDSIEVAVDTRALHFFDPDSGLAI